MVIPPRLRRSGATSLYLLRENYHPELGVFARILTKDMVFIDAGANLGLYTVIASRAVGPTGRVFAFEPGEESFAMLEKNALLQPINNMVLFRCALSDQDGEAPLFHVESAPASYSLGAAGADTFELVPLMTLDRLVKEQSLNRVDVIKIHVAGAEELVLRGANEALIRFRPIVFFQANSPGALALDLEPAGAWKALEAANYRFFTVDEHSDVIQLDEPRPGYSIALPTEVETDSLIRFTRLTRV